MPNTKLVVYTEREDIIGYVSNFGCGNDACHTAYINGRKWHATPSQFARTLPDYHFRSAEDAIQALHEAWDS